jgi:hypothetical protein
VTVFTAAAKAVVDAWAKGAVQAIANYLLDASAQGGFMGAVASKILGVDMSQEQAVAEKNRLAQIEVKKRLLEQAEKSPLPLTPRGTHRIDGRRVRHSLGHEVANRRIGAQSKGQRSTTAPVSRSPASASVNAFLDSVKAQAANRRRRRPQPANDRRPGGRRADVGRNNELDGLTKQAAKERAGIKDVQLPDKASLSQVSVGFSGAALAMQLQGGNGPQQQLLDKAKKQVDLLTEARDALFKIKDKLAGFGFAP